MEKFSVIIPTMWRCNDVFKQSLENLVGHDLIDQITIINNDVSKTPIWDVLQNSKIKLYDQETNIYVNPAWNLGVSLSKNKKLAILNDDIVFDIRVFDKLYDKIIPSNGAFGIITGEAVHNQPPSTDYEIDFITWKYGDIIHCFGQAMFLHKDNWVDIIPELRVYFGDDFIFHTQLAAGRLNYMIYNIKQYSPMAQTSGDKSITGGFYEREMPHYTEWSINNPIPHNVLNVMNIEEQYLLARKIPSDINQHIETLKKYADRCSSVTEFGVRTGISTRAVVASAAKKIRCYDLFLDRNVSILVDNARLQGKDIIYSEGNTRELVIDPTDMLFIDTEHTYGQLKAELERHHDKVSKYIAFHDTMTYGVVGEQGGGLLPAIMEFMRDHPHWVFEYISKENNGFTIIRNSKNAFKTILIAIPTNKNIEPETFKSVYDQKVPDGYKTEFQFFYGYQIDQIRNLIAEWGKHYDYVFAVDSDIVLPENTLSTLLAADKDIVSGMYIQRKAGQHILELYGLGDRGYYNIDVKALSGCKLVEIAACGLGCALIKGEVFRALEYPHFVYKSAINHANTFSEDIYFCDYARKRGFSVWVDCSIRCEHIGQTKFVVQFDEMTHLEKIAAQDLLPTEHANYLKQMKAKPQVIFDIGACVLHWTRKAKEVWPAANYFLFDASDSSLPFFQKSGHSYFLGPLSDTDDKKIVFYQDLDNPGGNSYYKENSDHYTEQHAVTKVAWTLDTVVEHNKWPLPDLIKMDIQGAELDVLRGAPKCLANVKDVILEAQHENYNEGAPKVEEIIDFMKSNGFTLVANFCRGNVDGDYHFTKTTSL